MNRIRWLAVAVFVLALANFTTRWWKNRGLITIHCEDWPASKVVKEIERQGGITIKTNLTDETKIRMHLDRVPLTEAMETFAVVSEGRWRLTYIFASGLGEIQNGINGLLSGERPEGWKRLFFRMPPMGDDTDTGPSPDPRSDVWQVKTPEKSDFQSYAQQAASSVNASIVFPEAWNPSVSKQPASGPIRKSAQALAKASNGRVLEVFLVQKNERNDGPPNAGEDRGPRFGRGEFRAPLDDAERDRLRQAFTDRAQAEIDKLPPDKRAAAQQRFDERRKFFEGMRDLPEAERRAKMEEFFSSEQNQERMESRESERMARMTPDQRVDRARQYVERKQAARSGTTNR
jgi:hypothetical protein